MKRIFYVSAVVTVLVMLLCACGNGNLRQASAGTSVTNQDLNTQENRQSESDEKEEAMKIIITVNSERFTATLENNAAAKEFYEMIKNGGVTVSMRDYQGFEKVGSLGRRLSSDDVQTVTEAGDIVLYQSNQIVMFYGSNSWSYTRLGRIDSLSGWEEALGGGNITAEFSVA